MKTLIDYYSEMNTDEDQKKISLTILAEKLGCMPWQVKEAYKSQLSKDNFNLNELKQTTQQWAMEKIKEGNYFKINPDNTSSAHLERWTKEYINENY
jgi:hypothetical protein